ncbi:MAG: hypothetical protein JW913_10455 [Chitinispirillaceae bacterium]|nr:hypothetical protein [Chitinispirillaceae bacterium]
MNKTVDQASPLDKMAEKPLGAMPLYVIIQSVPPSGFIFRSTAFPPNIPPGSLFECNRPRLVWLS